MGVNAATIRASHQSVVDDRRARVASFKVQGYSIRQTIAAMVKAGCVNPDTKKPWSLGVVQGDLEALTEQWKAVALRDITQAKADELAALDELEREAWAAWRRSIGRKQVRTTKTGRVTKDGDLVADPEVTLRSEELAGDPRFLDTIRNCRADRRKLLGLDAPAKVALGEFKLEDLVAPPKPETAE